MMLLKDFLNEGIVSLEPVYPAAEARNILLMLCEDRLGTNRYTHLVDPGYTIPSLSVPSLMDDLERLSSGEPVQYVLGYAEFMGRRFKVTPDVLIPRPETEILCELALKASPPRVLDLCTGSGCIAWTMALERPGSIVYGVDISSEALAVASSQVFPDRPSPVFLQADLLGEPLSFEGGKFDMVLSNPPYIMESQKKDMRSNVLGFEPPIALFVPDGDPLVFYRAIARWADALLAPGGAGIVEINELMGPQTEAVFLEAGFSKTEIVKDFYKKNRFVTFSR